MFASLVVATAAALAPAPLAKLAIDDGIRAPRRRRAGPDRGRVPALGGALRDRLRPPRPIWSDGSASARCRICACSLFAHLQQLSIGFYSRNRAGVIISRLTNDVEALDQLVEDGIATLFQSGLTLIGVVVILFVLDPHLALLTFLALPVLAVGGLRLQDRVGRRLPADAREDRVDHRLPAGERCRGSGWCARSARSRKHIARFARAQRREPRGEHDDRQPERGVLPGESSSCRRWSRSRSS